MNTFYDKVLATAGLATDTPPLSSGETAHEGSSKPAAVRFATNTVAAIEPMRVPRSKAIASSTDQLPPVAVRRRRLVRPTSKSATASTVSLSAGSVMNAETVEQVLNAVPNEAQYVELELGNVIGDKSVEDLMYASCVLARQSESSSN